VHRGHVVLFGFLLFLFLLLGRCNLLVCCPLWGLAIFAIFLILYDGTEPPLQLLLGLLLNLIICATM
jgi:hypothetical protein